MLKDVSLHSREGRHKDSSSSMATIESKGKEERESGDHPSNIPLKTHRSAARVETHHGLGTSSGIASSTPAPVQNFFDDPSYHPRNPCLCPDRWRGRTHIRPSR